MHIIGRKLFTHDLLFLTLLIIGAIVIRSIHFVSFLNFSQDQASTAIKALEIWREKQLTLIGPAMSFNLDGRYIFQGSLIYYFFLFFLLAGKWNPIISSYLFMLFSCLTVIPLYYGVLLLLKNRNSAFFLSMLYGFFPFYIDYTRFLWSPNFQFVLVPILILLMGIYARVRSAFNMFLVGMWAGILLQFHYQFILVILGLMCYYLFFQKESWRRYAIFLSGLTCGISPFLIFELRSHFYNFNTFILFLRHFKQVFHGVHSLWGTPHYFLSISLFVGLILIAQVKDRVSQRLLVWMSGFMCVASALIYLPYPQRPVNTSIVWKYQDEQKVYKIIKNQPYDDYNVSHLAYDNIAIVQKYFHQIDHNQRITYNDYYTNRYLYAVSATGDFSLYQAYEIKTFFPFHIVKTWKINDIYSLYLLKR